MATKTPDQHNKSNDKEEPYTASGIAKTIIKLKSALKSELDEVTDFRSCIEFLHNLLNYNTDAISLAKEKYQSQKVEKEFFLSLYQKTYDIYNGVYQDGLKKAESLGANPSETNPKTFPKSLEKITFPENN